MWSVDVLGSLGRDMRDAVRELRRSTAFTTVALLLLALGIGANTAIFTLVNAVLLKQLPVAEPDRLVTFSRDSGSRVSGVVWSLATLEEVRKRVPSLSSVFGWTMLPVSVSTGADAQWVNGEVITGDYFRTLSVRPALGILLSEDDVRDAHGDPVCVLSYGFWQRGFGADPGVVGRTVILNGHPYRVIGVAERRFVGADLQRRFDVAIPATRVGDFLPMFAGPGGSERIQNVGWLFPMARLAPGVTRAEAAQQIQPVLREQDRRRMPDVHVEDGRQGFNTMRRAFGRPVLVLMGVVTLVLLVACANLAHLLVARAQASSQEFAVRLSLGASRVALIRRLLIEALLLAVGGGIAGVALSFWITSTVVGFLNAGRPPASALHVAPDAFVLAFSTFLSIATVLFSGLVPAWCATSPDLIRDLKQDSTMAGLPRRMLLRRALVVTQVTASLVIVFTAGLLTATLRELATVDLGYDADRVLAMNIDPTAAGYSRPSAAAMLEEIMSRARALPSVSATSVASSTPQGGMLTANIDVPGYLPNGSDANSIVGFNFVGPYYFETLGQTLLRGRGFDNRDQPNSERVAIVNQAFVDRYLNGRDAVGQRFSHSRGRVEVTIVGVADDTRGADIRTRPVETVYMPVTQSPPSALTLLVRTEDNADRIVSSLTALVASIDRRMPIFSVRTLEQDVKFGLSSERLLGYFSTLFAVLATFVAGIGLHGLVSSSVGRRTREIGIRLALGAQPRDVVKLFGWESLALVLVGTAIGVPLAIGAARLAGNLLFGVLPHDLLTLGVSVTLLLLVTALATFPSLWRVSRLEPLAAIRRE